MLTKEERKMVNEATALILREVEAEGSVQVRGFGTFKKVERKAKAGRNPQTGAAVQIPARTVLAFKAAKAQVEAK